MSKCIYTPSEQSINELAFDAGPWLTAEDLKDEIMSTSDVMKGELNPMFGPEGSAIASLANKAKVEDGTHHWINAKHSSEYWTKRSKDGTHHWLGDSNPTSIAAAKGEHFSQSAEGKKFASKRELEKVKNGTHPFVGGEVQRKASLKRKLEGNHNILQIIECPHCGKRGNQPNMIRWHFDNCKVKGNV